MLSRAQKLSNKGFCGRLNTISAANNALANDVMYHKTCWVNAKREADKTYGTFSEKDYINALSDVEIVYFVGEFEICLENFPNINRREAGIVGGVGKLSKY